MTLPLGTQIFEYDVPAGDAPKPFWMLALAWRADGIAELERDLVRDLGVTVDVIDGLPPTYRSEEDCRKVAVAMMRRRPGLRVGVASPDGSFPSYVPLAHTIVWIEPGDPVKAKPAAV